MPTLNAWLYLLAQAHPPDLSPTMETALLGLIGSAAAACTAVALYLRTILARATTAQAERSELSQRVAETQAATSEIRKSVDVLVQAAFEHGTDGSRTARQELFHKQLIENQKQQTAILAALQTTITSGFRGVESRLEVLEDDLDATQDLTSPLVPGSPHPPQRRRRTDRTDRDRS